jgi:uncharacterized protein YutE (UPF0331/DUF86 family)
MLVRAVKYSFGSTESTKSVLAFEYIKQIIEDTNSFAKQIKTAKSGSVLMALHMFMSTFWDKGALNKTLLPETWKKQLEQRARELGENMVSSIGHFRLTDTSNEKLSIDSIKQVLKKAYSFRDALREIVNKLDKIDEYKTIQYAHAAVEFYLDYRWRMAQDIKRLIIDEVKKYGVVIKSQ